MAWIQPFEMQTFILNIFAGNPEIFFAVSLIAIIGMAAYFKMTQLTMFLMIGIFVFMFTGLDVIPISVLTLIILIAGLAIAFVINKILHRQ